MNVTQATIAKQFWKSPALDRYVAGLLAAALALYRQGTVFFNNDDCPEHYQPNDKTTVGVAIKLLINAHIIEPWRGTVVADNIFGGMRASSRGCTNGHRNQLYSLVNQAIAEEWLRRHGQPVEPRQLSLFPAPQLAPAFPAPASECESSSVSERSEASVETEAVAT